MPIVKEIRVKVTSEGDFQKSIAELEKLGKVDKANADQFVQTGQKHKAALKDSGDEVSRVEQKMRNLGERIIAVFAVERIIEWGKQLVLAFAKAQEATRLLKNAIVTVNGESERSFTKLNDQADKLSESLGRIFSTEDIQGVQTQLANFGLSADLIAKTVPRILDVAKAKGISAAEATEKFILAMNGQTKGLRDIGVSFKDTGSKLDNYNKLMDQTTKFTGSAADAMNSLQGQIDSTKGKLDEFEKKVMAFVDHIADVASSGISDDWDIILGNKSVAQVASKQLTAAYLDTYKKQADSFLDTLDKSGKSVDDKQKDIKTKVVAYYDQLKIIFAATSSALKKNDLDTAYALRAQAVGLEGVIKYLTGASNDLNNVNKIANNETDKTAKALKDLTDEIIAAKLALNEALISQTKDRLKDQADQDKRLADQTLGDQTLINKRKLEIDQRYYDDVAALDKKELDLKYQADVDKIKNENATQVQKNQLIQQLTLKLITDEQKIDDKASNDKLVAMQKYGDDEVKLQKDIDDAVLAQRKADLQNQNDIEDEMLRQGNIDLKKKLDDGLITQHDYDLQVAKNDLAASKDKAKNTLAADQAEIDALEKTLHTKGLAQDDYDKAVADLDAAKKKLQLDSLKVADDVADKMNTVAEKEKEAFKDITKNFFDFTGNLIKGLEDAIQANINAIDTMQARQAQMIDFQKTLAERGLADLAFEERRADELSRKKAQEQKKLQRAKELETFLNALSKFAEDNPNTALAKALGLLAATKAAETVFAEKGGVVGSLPKYRSGMKHRNREFHVVAEEGERILSRDDTAAFEAWGGLKMLRMPLREKMIPVGVAMSGGYHMSEVVGELREVKKELKNLKQFDAAKFIEEEHAFVISSIEKGVKSNMKIMSRKPRI